MKNYLVIFSYKGDHFYGSQKQKSLPTVQQLFEDILSDIYATKIRFLPASRLDRGVHALRMGGNYKVDDDKIALDKIKYVLNRLLPLYIRVYDVKEVLPEFNSRFNAVKKTYLYRLHTAEGIDPFSSELTYHPIFSFNYDKLLEAAELFVGTHNYRGFASSVGEKENTVLSIDKVCMTVLQDEVQLRFIGKSFLRYQIRYMVGAALEYAEDRQALEDIKKRLETGEIGGKRFKVPGCGLFLEDIAFDFTGVENV